MNPLVQLVVGALAGIGLWLGLACLIGKYLSTRAPVPPACGPDPCPFRDADGWLCDRAGGPCEAAVVVWEDDGEAD